MAACCTFDSNGGTIPAEREREKDRGRVREAGRESGYLHTIMHDQETPLSNVCLCLIVYICAGSLAQKR